VNDQDLIRHQHYLERAVERTGGAELDFALQLYQDPALLTGVLAEASLPVGDSRIALGLDPAGNGPWLVVSRGAEFVTVLGKDMKTPGLHTLPATQVASLVARVLRQRQRESAADAVVPASRREAFLDRFFRHGSDVTREDFLLFVAWLPMMYETYKTVTAVRLHLPMMMLADARTWLRLPLKKSERHLRLMHESFWACSAMLPLMAYEGRRHDWLQDCGRLMLKQTPSGRKITDEVQIATVLPTLMTGDGHLAPILRAAWAVGRIGKPILPIWKQALRDATLLGDYQAALFGLVTMAYRHASLRAEIRKLVTSRQPLAQWGPGMVQYHAGIAQFLEEWLDKSEQLLAWHLQRTRGQAFELVEFIGGELKAKYPTPDSIPESYARLMGTLVSGDMREGRAMGFLIANCCWLAHIEAEELFPPAELMKYCRTPWVPEHSYMLLRQRLGDQAMQQPVRAPERQGRNEPCACGSGRKFKSCCTVSAGK
jgi:hypothetical protein